ncbi:hypothetical protein Emag_005064 [Eimeria magna]
MTSKTCKPSLMGSEIQKIERSLYSNRARERAVLATATDATPGDTWLTREAVTTTRQHARLSAADRWLHEQQQQQQEKARPLQQRLTTSACSFDWVGLLIFKHSSNLANQSRRRRDIDKSRSCAPQGLMASFLLGLAARQAASVAAASGAAAGKSSSGVYVCRTAACRSSSVLSVGCGATLCTGLVVTSSAFLSSMPFDASAASAANAATTTAAAAAAAPLGALPVPSSHARAVTSPGDAGLKGSRGDVQQQEAKQQQQQQKKEENRQQEQEQQQQQQQLCLSDDAAGAAALSTYTTPELYRSLLVYSLCSCSGLVENSERMLALSSKLLGSRLTFSALRHTLFKVFCGGENLDELTKTLDRLQQRNLGAVLDFAAEQPVPTAGLLATKAAAAIPAATAATALAQTSTTADPYEGIVRRTRETITLASERGGGYAAMKVSAIGDPEAMQRFSCLLFHVDRLFGILAAGDAAAAAAEMPLTLLVLPVMLLLRLVLLVLLTLEALLQLRVPRLIAAAELASGIEPQAMTGRPCPDRLAAAVVSRQQFVSALARLHVDPNHADALFEHLLQQPGGDRSSNSSKSSSSEGKLSYFQWSHRVTPETAGHVGPMRCLSKVLPVLHPEDLASYKATHTRFYSLCDFARRQQNPPMLLVDAEQSTMQTYIHALALEAQKKYNTETPAVGSTYQAYLKDTYARLTRDLELARRFGFILSVKLVRGAYVNFERKLAQETGEAPLIHDSIQETHDCYDACVRLLFDNLDQVQLFLASHNTASLEKAAELIRQAERERGASVSSRVAFGQLYGMADAASHGLATAGFSVYKYLPFGPVEETIPYLVRRVQENGGVMGGARREVQCLLREIKRRAALGARLHQKG